MKTCDRFSGFADMLSSVGQLKQCSQQEYESKTIRYSLNHIGNTLPDMFYALCKQVDLMRSVKPLVTPTSWSSKIPQLIVCWLQAPPLFDPTYSIQTANMPIYVI